MKTILRILTPVLAIMLCMSATVFVSPAEAHGLNGNAGHPQFFSGIISQQQVPESDKVVLGGSYILEPNQTLNGNLFLLGGTAQLNLGSTVVGDVLVIGGTLVAGGEIGGDVSVLGGLVTLEKGVHIRGDVNTLSATLQRDEGAVVEGQINEITSETWPAIIPEKLQLPEWQGVPSIIPGETQPFIYGSPLKTGWDFLWVLVRSLAWAALAVLTALFGPKIVARTSDAAVEKPFVSSGMGCLTVFLGTTLLVLLAITICGIPFSLLIGLLLTLAWALGVISIGTETGNRFSKLFKADWALPVSAGVGTFLLTLIANAVELLIPCLGWLLPVGIGLVGLGAVVLTRFGTQPYPQNDVLHVQSQPEKHLNIVDEDTQWVPEEEIRSDQDVDLNDNDRP